MPLHAPLRAVPLGFWGVVLGAALLAQALLAGPRALAWVGVALLGLGAWRLRAWWRGRDRRGRRGRRA